MSSGDIDRMVQVLDDTRQIVNALNVYGLAIDTHRYELFDQVFAEEIEANYPPPVFYRTREEAKAHMRQFHAALDGSQHNITNPQVIVDGDRATSVSYVVVRLVKGSRFFQMGCFYDDTWIRTPEGWRIKTRLCRGNWWEGDPGVGGDVTPGAILEPRLHTLRTAAEAGELSYLKRLSGKT